MWWPYRPEVLAVDLWAEILEDVGMYVRTVPSRRGRTAGIQAIVGRVVRLDVTVGGAGRLWCGASAAAAEAVIGRADPVRLWVEVGECDGQNLASVADVTANVRRLARVGDVTADP
jgi:hypothetical protein